MNPAQNQSRQYVTAAAIVLICTLIAGAMFDYFAPANLIMVYLVGVVLAAVRLGRGEAILASILSVAAFDFFFVNPYLNFAISDTEYLLTFAVMLLVALTISTLTAQIKQQAEIAEQREQRTDILYQLSREFANNQGIENLVRAAAQQMSRVFESQVVILLPEADQKFTIYAAEKAETIHDQGVAEWVYKNRLPAGFSTESIPGVKGLYLPLMTSSRTAGVLVIYPRQQEQPFSPEQHNLLETFANQIALAIERAHLAHEAEASRLEIESERLRNALLSSISHDLRTPLASITGAASSLLQTDPNQELTQIIYEEAERLNRLVGNLLDMTRIESGGIHVKKEWELLEEVIGSTLLRMKKELNQHTLQKNLPENLLLVPMDSILIEQVLVNLLENAVKYSSPGTTIDLNVNVQAKAVEISIADHGAGIPAGAEERIFEKFYRAAPENSSGVGLGLAICRSIIEAHGGHIWAENRSGGGSIFRFTLPLTEQPPEVMLDE